MRENGNVKTIIALSFIGVAGWMLAGCSNSNVQLTGISGVDAGTSAVKTTDEPKSEDSAAIKTEHSNELSAPVALTTKKGKRIDIGKLSPLGHAGPTVADVDNDGDQDLLVGDFPGYFWYFENTNNDEEPQYVSQGKLQAGGEDARTPVY